MKNVADERAALWRATKYSLGRYREWPVLTRVVGDVIACALLLTVWFLVGGQARWTAPYYGAVLVAWVMSDFSSNLLIIPNDRVARAVHLDRYIGRTLLAENLALALWLFPFGALSSLISCWQLHRMGDYPCAVVSVAAVLGVWLGVGDVVSVHFPRQPLELHSVRAQRPLWREDILRALAYFGTMFVVGPLASAPAFLGFYRALSQHGATRWLWLLSALLWGALVWVTGWRWAVPLARRRRDEISAVLHTKGPKENSERSA